MIKQWKKLCTLLCALGALQGVGQAHAEIVVGQVAPLSGVLAETGKDMVLGAKIYFDHINASGGVNGQKIKHVVRDDGYDVEKTVALTRELIDKDNAHVLFGYAGTGNVGKLLELDVLGKAGIALVAPYTGAISLREPYNPSIFHVRANYADETKAMVNHFVTNGVRRIAVFYQNDPFGEAGLAGVNKALEPHNIKLVAAASYPKNTTDVAAAVKTILAAKPQAICMISVNKSTAEFVKQYKATGNTAFFFNISVVNPDAMAAHTSAEAIRGMGITQVVPSPFGASSRLTAEYQTLLKKYGGKDARPSYTSFEEFIGAKVLVEGLKQAKSIQREAIVDALEGLGKLDLGGFHVTYGKGRRAGSSYVGISVVGANAKLIH